ncbi:MAG: hypothetical protein K2H82_09540, partial [Oscillospiraceae bacterium]|nr:hypothetical protein [Oscillospiraceae bacterium]
MYNPQQLRTEIYNAEHGAERLQLLSSAIQEADQNQDHYWRLAFRKEYINESIFYGDSFKAVIQFPEYLKIFDEHPEFEEEMSFNMMWAFKNVLENMSDYHQISRAEIENYFEEFEKRGKKYGESLRTYYMKKCKFYLPVDLELAKENYEKFRKYPRSSNSDCEACELSFSMRCELAFGNEERALQIAKPILDGEMTCAEIPHSTYGKLARYYLYHHNLTEAFYYGTLCEKLILGEPEFLEETGTLLELYSIVNPGHGWNILKHAIPDFVDCKNTLMEVSFARGAYRLMKSIAESTEDGKPVFMSNANLHLLPVAKTQDGWLASDVMAYFCQIAEDLSQKLDVRNQNTHFQDILHTEFSMEKFQAFSESGESRKPAHGITRKEELLLLISVPEAHDFKILAEKIRNDTRKDFAIQVCDGDDADDLYLSVRYENQIYDLHIIPKPDTLTNVYAKSVYQMTEKKLQDVMEAPVQYLLITEIPGDAMTAYHVYMEIINILFPELLGVVNLHARKAYPPEWVRFAGMFAHAVSPYDVFGIYITGTEDGSDAFMTTCGLCTLGMRELELIGANAENFGYFATM